MIVRNLNLFFCGTEHIELVSTELTLVQSQVSLTCVRGKSSGAFKGAGTFQWTSAVRGACSILLRHHLQSFTNGIQPYLSGGRGSCAASLDYAITKQPLWMVDMFGTDSDGSSLLRRLLLRSNSNLKRVGPVAVSVNPNKIAGKTIQVYLNDVRITSARQLVEILDKVEIKAKILNLSEEAQEIVSNVSL